MSVRMMTGAGGIEKVSFSDVSITAPNIRKGMISVLISFSRISKAAPNIEKERIEHPNARRLRVPRCEELNNYT